MDNFFVNKELFSWNKRQTNTFLYRESITIFLGLNIWFFSEVPPPQKKKIIKIDIWVFFSNREISINEVMSGSHTHSSGAASKDQTIGEFFLNSLCFKYRDTPAGSTIYVDELQTNIIGELAASDFLDIHQARSHKLGNLNTPRIFFFKDNKAPNPKVTSIPQGFSFF